MVKDLQDRAAKLATHFGFENAGLIRAEIVIASGNTASIRVAEKIGAHYEGILLNRMVVGKLIYNAHMYSLLPLGLWAGCAVVRYSPYLLVCLPYSNSGAGVSVGVSVAVGKGVLVNVGVEVGVWVGVRVNVGVMVGVSLGVGVKVNVTAGRSMEPIFPSPSSSRKIQPPSYCWNAGSG